MFNPLCHSIPLPSGRVIDIVPVQARLPSQAGLNTAVQLLKKEGLPDGCTVNEKASLFLYGSKDPDGDKLPFRYDYGSHTWQLSVIVTSRDGYWRETALGYCAKYQGHIVFLNDGSMHVFKEDTVPPEINKL